MLKNHKIDFAIVAVPHDQYIGILNQLANRHIHILKEKPLALNIKEAIAIRDLVQKSRVELMVTLQRRFNPIFSTFIQLMKHIGQHFYVEAKYSMFVENPADGWRGEKKRAGGGCIIDMGYHPIDLIIWYLGLPDQIHAELRTAAKPMKYYDAEDTAAILFRYSDRNLFGTLQLSRFIPPKVDYLKLVGAKGIVEVKRGELVRYHSNGEVAEKLIREKQWAAAATTQIDYFCDVILGVKPNFGNAEYHLQHMAFIEACYRSQKLGRFINPFDILHQYV
jgi:predicted dehydrogenase